MPSYSSFIIIACIYAAICICTPFITLFHELGHAIAYLILTKPAKIDIYIGSHGDIKPSYSFSIGKLRFFVKHSFSIIKGGGLCKSYSHEDNYIYKALILLAGPAFSLFVAVALSYIAFNFDLHSSVKLLCIILVMLSGIGFITNVVPRTISLKNGTLLYNDGKQLVFTIRARKVFKTYIAGLGHLTNNKQDLALQHFNQVLAIVPDDEHLLRLIISVLHQQKEYREALSHYTVLKKRTALQMNDYLTLGILQSLNNQSEDAIGNYKIVLNLNKDQPTAMSNLGYEFIRQGDYRSATIILERAIHLYTDFSYPYSNLGCCKVLQGDLETGKELIDKSIKLYDGDAYAYKHLGIYYLKKQNPEQALCCLHKALELDWTIDLEPYLNDARLLTARKVTTGTPS